MTSLNELYELFQELEEKITEHKEKQKPLEATVDDMKKKRWDRMWEDIINYLKYSKIIDTGIPDRTKKRENFAFEIRNRQDEIGFITIKKRRFKKHLNDPYDFGDSISVLKKDEPFQLSYCMREPKRNYYHNKLEKIAANWESIIPYIGSYLVSVMKQEMKNKVKKSVDEQNKLEKDLKKFS